MGIAEYFPTFRNILIEKIEKQSKGGIILPFDSKPPEENWFRVVKTGRDCIEVQTGDQIRLTQGVRIDIIDLEDKQYGQVMEQQIIGYFRNG